MAAIHDEIAAAMRDEMAMDQRQGAVHYEIVAEQRRGAVQPEMVTDQRPARVHDGVFDIPPAFYRDEDPPDPPAGDPHWREFPFFENARGAHLLIGFVAFFVIFATVVHLAVLLFI